MLHESAAATEGFHGGRWLGSSSCKLAIYQAAGVDHQGAQGAQHKLCIITNRSHSQCAGRTAADDVKALLLLQMLIPLEMLG